MRCQDLLPMLDLIRLHNRETHHEIIEASDPVQRTIGFACASCNDDEHTWEIGLTRLRQPEVPPEIIALFTPTREGATNMLNEHTEGRTFGGPQWDGTPSGTDDPQFRQLEAIWHERLWNLP